MSGAWIQTASGHQLFPFRPDMERVVATDIAHHLANQCRFVGACDPFYSVAEHCVRGAREIRRRIEESGGSKLDEHDLRVVLAFLLHDAEEYGLMDLPAPLKELPELRFYVAAGDHLRGLIYSKFGVTPEAACNPMVREIDLVMLATEKRDLMVEPPAPWLPLPRPLVDPIIPWSAEAARGEFLHYWQSLALEGGFPLPVSGEGVHAGKPSTLRQIVDRAVNGLTEKEKEILRKRFRGG